MLPKAFSPSPHQGAASPELGPGATVAPEVQPAQNEYTLIIDRKEEKELLYRGGYKDVRDGTTYLNACAQTRVPWPPRAKKQWPKMISRETQKSELRNRVKQTVREAYTQMQLIYNNDDDATPTVVIDTSFDYYRIPGPYEDSNAWEEKRRLAAIVIQKYLRRKIAQLAARRMRRYAIEKRQFWKEHERTKEEERKTMLQWELERRINPRTAADFEVLYQELENWRFQENAKIHCNQAANRHDKTHAFKELLTKELKLLQALDTLRRKAAKLNRQDRIANTLTRMGRPKLWEMSNGRIVHVQTPATNRASDLGQLYKELTKRVDSMDTRMGVLGYVKWMVQVFHTPLIREILLLIEREADLMFRGRPASSLNGLRQRILNLFLQFVETPEFNPEAVSFLYVPVDFDHGKNRFPMMRDMPAEFP
ncbi:unnamed protein product [Sphagnum compactum]